MDQELEDVVQALIESLKREYEQQQRQFRSQILWDALVLNGKFSLLQKLHNAEINFAGYATMVVPPEGFSENDTIHNMVLDWCQDHKITVLNPGLEIERLERTLHPV